MKLNIYLCSGWTLADPASNEVLDMPSVAHLSMEAARNWVDDHMNKRLGTLKSTYPAAAFYPVTREQTKIGRRAAWVEMRWEVGLDGKIMCKPIAKFKFERQDLDISSLELLAKAAE